MNLQRAERLFRRGMELHKRGAILDALRVYGAIIAAHPGYAPALHHAALATQQVRRHARAKGIEYDDGAAFRLFVAAIDHANEIAQKAAATAPDAFLGSGNPFAHARLAHAAMVHNFAKFQQDRGALDGPAGARALYEAAIGLNPDLSEAWTNLGNVYGELGNRLRSDAAFARALQCPAVEAETVFNLSFLRIMKGDFEQGWRDYEARWACPEFLLSYGRPDLTAPRWNGEQFDGTLYLHGEQGAGDVIMMARYIPQVLERCRGGLYVEVLEGLVSYFRETFIVSMDRMIVVPRGGEIPPHDAQLPMMSLPAVCGTSIATIPAPVPTRFHGIRSDPRKIGVCWKGSATHVNDRNRSMPTAELAPLLALEGYTWQSLQFGVDDVAGLQPLISTDYLDTAREIASCGLVITVDTSVAHLAATLGVETWILLPHHAEWRWMQDRDNTPWYPSAKLWRQQQPGSWANTVIRLRTALADRRHMHGVVGPEYAIRCD